MSMSMKREAILLLYESISSGVSSCHSTGHKKKATGGWYSFSCKHGVIYGSKVNVNIKGDSDKNGILYFNLWVFCGFLTTKHHPKCYLLIECSQNQVQKHSC